MEEDSIDLAGVLDRAEPVFLDYRKQLKEGLETDEKMETDWVSFYQQPKLEVVKEDEKHEIIDFSDILEEGEDCAVIGEPGIGKSTFLKWIGHYLCSDHQNKLPVFIDLAAYGGSDDDKLSEYIIGKTGLSEMLKDNLNSALGARNVVLLFDALDECPADNIIPQLNTLKNSADYSGNQFVLSSRLNYCYGQELGEFQQLKIQPFSQEEIKEYLKKKLGNGDTVYQKLFEMNMLELCSLPLMLRFATEVADELDEFTNRTSLYQLFIQKKFMGREGKEKQKREFARDEAIKEIDILAELALFMQTDENTIGKHGGNRIYSVRANELLNQGISELAGYSTGEGIKKIRDEIRASGLVLHDSQDETFYFLHKTIQEFLAAKAIASRVKGRKTLDILPKIKGEFSIKKFMDSYVRYEDTIFGE